MAAAVDKWANVDTWPGGTGGPFSGPATSVFAVATWSGTVDLPYVTRAVYIGSGGSLQVTMQDGSAVTIPGLVAGTMLPLRIKQVIATGTTISSPQYNVLFFY